MDDLSRAEYPAMLANLQPSQAVHTLNERVKRIAKINSEIADWLQERRRVEEQYVAALKKLLLFKVPNAASELGVFQPSWDKVLQSTDSIAASHHLFAQRIEKDVEAPLRNYQGRKEMQNIHTMSSNLSTMARELEEAQERADKLTRKGGKASAMKVDTATAKLESSQSQWESQAPFIFETLQALDEQRCNHLRDVLTQLQTHEVDHADRLKASANDVLNTVLEVSTPKEIEFFAQRTIAGRPKLEPRRTADRVPASRQSSVGPGTTTPVTPSAPPAAPPPHPFPPQHQHQYSQDDARSDHSGPSVEKEKPESKLRSRIGTMLGRRRQSIHGGFGPLSPQKGHSPFVRNIGSSHGRAVSPRASSQNLSESTNRLPSLTEADTAEPRSAPGSSSNKDQPAHDATTNGVPGTEASGGIGPVRPTPPINGATAEEIFDAPPPPGPPPSHQPKAAERATDADGFTIPQTSNDPISQAQREAAAEGGEEHDQLFKLNIQSSPVAEEDPEAKQAALSNVTNALSTMGLPSRRAGTIRGRRDVRNTIYLPAAPVLPESSSLGVVAEPTQAMPPSPALPVTLPAGSSSVNSRPSAIQTLASEASVTGTSDTQSVRSATSLGSLAHGKHPEMSAPGLNSSIVESVSATFEDGVVKSVKISGEIAFAYNPDGPVPTGYEIIRVNNFPSLEAIGPNRIFVSNTPAEDEFSLDLSHLPSRTATPAFTYRLHADDPTSDLASHCPLAIKPTWKPAGDKLGLLLQYRLNPGCHLPNPVVLHNLVFVATYENARASGVQTKPAGTHLKDKHIVYWRLGDVTLNEGADWSKIVCRVIGAENGEPHPGHIEARWEYTHVVEGAAGSAGGISVSQKVEGKGKEKAEEEVDPFADDDSSALTSPKLKDDDATWVDVPLARKLVSGRYEAK